MTPTVKPAGRYEHAMVFDSARGKTVVDRSASESWNTITRVLREVQCL